MLLIVTHYYFYYFYLQQDTPAGPSEQNPACMDPERQLSHHLCYTMNLNLFNPSILTALPV